MDLFCCEAQVDFECRAYADPTILKDVRVLDNLLSSEERHVLSSSYFDCVQSELKPHMRKVVTEWMLEVNHFLFLFKKSLISFNFIQTGLRRTAVSTRCLLVSCQLHGSLSQRESYREIPAATFGSCLPLLGLQIEGIPASDCR